MTCAFLFLAFGSGWRSASGPRRGVMTTPEDSVEAPESPPSRDHALVQIVRAVLDFIGKIVADIDDGNYVGAGIRSCVCGEAFLFGMFFGVLAAFWIENPQPLLWMIVTAIIVLTLLLTLLLVRRPLPDKRLALAQAHRSEQISPKAIG